MVEPYIHKVKYYECDRMGVTHHSNYIRFMEESRIDMLDRIGYGFEKMEAEGVVSPVTEVHCNYKKTTTFQDEIAVDVFVEDISALKLRIGYVMTCRGEVVFTGSSVHCFIENGRPVAFGNRFPGFIEALAPYRREHRDVYGK